MGRDKAPAAMPGEPDLIAAVLGAVDDGIAVYALDGTIVYANRAAVGLIGAGPGEQSPTSADVAADLEILAADGRPVPVERLPVGRVIAGELRVEEELRYRVTATGEERIVRVRAVPLGDRDGPPRLVICVFHDLTERRRRDRELRDPATLLDALFETAPVGLAFLDREHRFVRVNGALAAMNGLPAAAHVGRTPYELFPGLDPSVAARFRRVLETGEALLDQEESGETPAAPGGLRHWSTSYYPIAAAGQELAGAGVVVLETTARKRVERERERLARVTEAALGHRLSLDELLAELLARLAEALAADTIAIFLVDDERETMRIRATAGLERDTGADDGPIPIGTGFAGRVALGEATSVLADAAMVELANPALHGLGIRSLVAVPLLVDGKPIGALRAGARVPDAFGADAGRLVALAADRIALAIDQTRLYEAERAARAEAQAAQERLAFLVEASEALGSSLDVEETLAALARLAVPRLGDWCAVHLVREDASVDPVAIVHADARTAARAEASARRHPVDRNATTGIAAAIRSGRSELVPEMDEGLLERIAAERPGQAELLRPLAGASTIVVPLWVRGRVFGTITLIASESGRRFDESDLALAEELARRAAAAVEHALLYREAEDRGRAARILQSVGDGVVLVDGEGVVRYWNRAAEEITGLAGEAVVDHLAGEAIPGWAMIEPLVPIGQGARPESMPLQLDAREAWLSISGVALEEGTVYAFRDLTEERALEELRADFVATVSHELRTPLAAIYGASMTLRRQDVRLREAQRETLLGVIASESDRLARTINDILWASRLDSGTLSVAIESCDALELARAVVEAQQAHLPRGVELALEAAGPLPPVAADADKVRQVLANLLDNAVKYSPGGGRVTLTCAAAAAHVRFAVADRGIGIEHAEQRRIFEKFYRADPQLARGVGGTGLGLYICRELVHRMNGRLWVESSPGAGSTFVVELPAAVDE